MRKHFQIEITDTTFTYTRDSAGIAAEAALDELYIRGPASPRTTCRPGCRAPTKPRTGRAGVRIDRGSRSADPSDPSPPRRARPRARTDLHARLLPHRHLKAAWKPSPLPTDEHRPSSPDPVHESRPLTRRAQKAQTKRTSTGQPAHSYRTLLAELTLPRPGHHLPARRQQHIREATQPTALQAQALELAANAPVLGVR